MTERRSITELRGELRSLYLKYHLPATKISRNELEQQIDLMKKFGEMKEASGKPKPQPSGRKPAREIPDGEENEEGFIVPKKPNPSQLDSEKKKEKKKKEKEVPVVEVDSGTGSESEEEEAKAKKSAKKVEKAEVKKTLSDEQRAKLKDIVEKNKPKRTISDEQKAKMKAGKEAKKAEAKKEAPPPDAPEPETKKTAKLPVFKIPQ